MEKTEDPVPVFVLSLPDEVSMLARTLSRTIPMQILKQLRKKQMSAGELASEIGIRLNTLAYNLELLEKTGLIKVMQVKWSCKGREIKIYAPAEQPILLVPRANRDDSPFVLDALEKALKNSKEIFPRREVSFIEESGKNDMHISSEKNNTQEALPIYTRYTMLFSVKDFHEKDDE